MSSVIKCLCSLDKGRCNSILEAGDSFCCELLQFSTMSDAVLVASLVARARAKQPSAYVSLFLDESLPERLTYPALGRTLGSNSLVGCKAGLGGS